jgi:hypothetical protein
MTIPEKLEKYDQLKEELEKLQDLTNKQREESIQIEPDRYLKLYMLQESVHELEKELRSIIKHRKDK